MIRYIGATIDRSRTQVKIVDKHRPSPTCWKRHLGQAADAGGRAAACRHPFSSHPRLDLFVGSLSPHKMADVGCTICHEGQGSATAFNGLRTRRTLPNQADKWKNEHGWFNNHHWIFPMSPTRFAESSCLKCHHEVTELEPSERFPDPPAPKLMAGLQPDPPVRLFRLPRDQRLRRAEQAPWSRHAGRAQVLRRRGRVADRSQVSTTSRRIWPAK